MASSSPSCCRTLAQAAWVHMFPKEKSATRSGSSLTGAPPLAPAGMLTSANSACRETWKL